MHKPYVLIRLNSFDKNPCITFVAASSFVAVIVLAAQALLATRVMQRFLRAILLLLLASIIKKLT